MTFNDYVPGRELSDWQAYVRAERITRLIEDKLMSVRAATTVVDAAMFGIGCTEGRVRERIEREKTK